MPASPELMPLEIFPEYFLIWVHVVGSLTICIIASVPPKKNSGKIVRRTDRTIRPTAQRAHSIRSTLEESVTGGTSNSPKGNDAVIK